MTKKKLKRLVIRWLSFVIVLTAVLYWHKTVVRYGYKAYRFMQQYHTTHNLANHVNFPEAYSVHGIDISRYQPDIDWNTLQAVDIDHDTVKFQFVIIKATEGLFWEDPTFQDNWNDAKSHHVIRGAYHYFKPNANAKLQAINFINSVKLKPGDLPPVIDAEEVGRKGKKDLVKSLKVFISAIEKHYGVKPIIYANVSFIEDYLADDFGNYKFWVAHFYKDDLKVSGDIKWLFWQHHDKARLLHSTACYDVNVFNGSRVELKKILLQ